MADLLLGLLVGVAAAVALYFGPRLIGLGRCRACGRGCAPWDAYCRRFHEGGER